MRWIKCILEFQKQTEVSKLGEKHRGIYVLYDGTKAPLKNGNPRLDVVYIGMADVSIAKRLRSHKRSKRKIWTHFSAYVVWPNISKEEVRELEGLLR